MFHWYSPFPLEPSLQESLGAAGLRPVLADAAVSIDLLLYETPDAALNLWRQQAQPAPEPEALVEAYRQLLQLRDGARLISTWRLRQLRADELLGWLQGQADCPTLDAPPPAIDALSAVVTRRLLEWQAEALEAYLDLELQAELAGNSPDSDYILRLDSSANGDTLLACWWQAAEHEARSNQLAGEVARLHDDKEILLQAKDAERQGANELKQQLDSKAQILVEAQEENQHTMLALQEAQEELECNFLKSREQEEQLQALEAQLTELKGELAVVSKARDAALETRDDLRQQLATALDVQQSATASNADLINQLQERNQSLMTADKDLKEVQKQAELTIVRLHQAQEELEHYFLRANAGDELCQAQACEHSRAIVLLGRMIRLQAGA